MAYRPFDETFERLVTDELAKWKIPGASFSVVHGDETWSKGFGEAQRHPSKPVESRTLFYAASTTKSQLCAAWAIYLASDENQIKGDAKLTFATPLADLIPDDFVLQDPVLTRQVTIEDAVSHRTGMPRHELSYGYPGVKTTRDLTRNLRNLPIHNTFRTHFEYCNTMYVAASHALETVTGKPLGHVLRELLWDPLGMQQTYAGYGDAARAVEQRGEVLARGHTWTKLPGDPDCE